MSQLNSGIMRAVTALTSPNQVGVFSAVHVTMIALCIFPVVVR